jgi:hypothetical protein
MHRARHQKLDSRYVASAPARPQTQRPASPEPCSESVGLGDGCAHSGQSATEGFCGAWPSGAVFGPDVAEAARGYGIRR